MSKQYYSGAVIKVFPTTCLVDGRPGYTMDWHPIQGVPQSHSQCSWDRLQNHCNPGQDQEATNEQINERTN